MRPHRRTPRALRLEAPACLVLLAVLAAALSARASGSRIPDVVAEGDGVVVTGSDLLQRARLVAAFLPLPADDPGAQEQLLGLAARMVQQLVNLVLVEVNATREGVRPDPAEVDRRVAAAERRSGGPQALRAVLAAWGVTVDDLRRELEREVLWDAYLERFARRAVILEEFARRLYEDNRGLYRIPDRYRIAGVVFRYRRPAEEFRRAVLRGVDFVALARRVVADPFLQAQGGEVGWLEDTRMHPWVLRAVVGLRPGELTPVFAGPPGWYVVRLEGLQRGRPLRYEEARPAILEDLRRSSARTDLYILVGQLRRELRVRVLWPGEEPVGAPGQEGGPLWVGSWGLPAWSSTSGHRSGGG